MANNKTEVQEAIDTLGINKATISDENIVNNLLDLIKNKDKYRGQTANVYDSLSIRDTIHSAIKENKQRSQRLAEALSTSDKLEEYFGYEHNYKKPISQKYLANGGIRFDFINIVNSINDNESWLCLAKRREKLIRENKLDTAMSAFYDVLYFCASYNLLWDIDFNRYITPAKECDDRFPSLFQAIEKVDKVKAMDTLISEYNSKYANIFLCWYPESEIQRLEDSITKQRELTQKEINMLESARISSFESTSRINNK